MHSCVCYQWLTLPRTVYIFILRLWACPFSGLVGQSDSTPIYSHPPSGMPSICPFVCLFFKVVFQHLGYLIFLTSQLYLIWTDPWGLRSVLKGPLLSQCLRRFLRGFHIFQRIFPIVPVRYGLYVPYNIFGGLRSFSGYLNVWQLVWRRFCGLLLVP